LAKSQGARKKKETDKVPVQEVVDKPVTAVLEPAVVPLTEEEKEFIAVRERAKEVIGKNEETYNREVVPKLAAKLKAVLKKLSKKATTEQILKAAFDARNDGKDAINW
jgi:hypothetical protein